eukprot:GFUD01019899.1.p1 GENE.GFUD01019899.1~~GFUD01019899.1.p1  ORF type:complete len:604 (+),score=138.00 GFUD01019899.1:68-1879(+)
MFSKSRISVQHCAKALNVIKQQNTLMHDLLGIQLAATDFVPTKAGLIERIFGKKSNEATPSTNRWSMFVPAALTHISLGSPYGWSAISAALSREHGFVVSAASDWSLELATYPMAIIMACGGISATLVGRWQGKVGCRRAMATGGILFSSGLVLTAAGVMNHWLPLVYAGNLLSGLGYGCAYTPPIQALITWFPDRRGLASGVVIGGSGSGALFFMPAISNMCIKFGSLPTYLGSSLDIVVENGRQFRKVGDQLQEVVYATAADLAKLPYDGLMEGFYVVGSGNTGVTASLATIGAIYGVTILAASLIIKQPHKDYIPEGYTPPQSASGANVHVDNVFKTPQFWLLCSTATLLATGGAGLMSVAKPMIQNIFTGSMPLLVTPAFASSYILALAAGNLGGRIGWGTVSDKIGRWNTFQSMTLVAVPMFASIPFLITQCIANPSSPMAPYYLAAYCGSTMGALSVMGGVWAVLPAYEADLYGAKYVGAIHGKLLFFSAGSPILGPTILLNLTKMAESNAIKDLLSKVDSDVFMSKFGAPVCDAQTLIEAKTLTISNLMTIMPPGTIDPSPFLYNNAMYTMAGLASVASVLHFMVKPVDKKYFDKN